MGREDKKRESRKEKRKDKKREESREKPEKISRRREIERSLTPPGGNYLETPPGDYDVVENDVMIDDVVTMGDETPTRDETSDHIISEYVPRSSSKRKRVTSPRSNAVALPRRSPPSDGEVIEEEEAPPPPKEKRKKKRRNEDQDHRRHNEKKKIKLDDVTMKAEKEKVHSSGGGKKKRKSGKIQPHDGGAAKKNAEE